MLFLLLGLLFASCSAQVVKYGQVYTGQLTFYGAGADSGGTCMYNNPSAALAKNYPTVAIGDFGNAEKCGACVEITPLGTGSGNSDFPTRKPFVAYVNNQCPECGPNNLDLAQTGDGRWDITWKYVDCAQVSGNVEIQLKTGSSVYWTEISARNFKVAIQSIEFQINGAWSTLTRKSYNYFDYTSGTVTLPVTARFTSVCGEQKTYTITDYNFLEPATRVTNFQFSSCGGGSPPTAPVTPPTKPPVAPVTPPTAPVTPPTKPPVAPVTPPTAPVAPVTPPTKPPQAAPSSSHSCTYTSSTNNWWIEYNSDTTTATGTVTCADNNNYPCTVASWGTYQCSINRGVACAAPRRAIIGGVCCSLDAGACGAAVYVDSETSTTQTANDFPTGAIIAIAAGTLVVVIVIVVIVIRKLRSPVMEHV